MFYNVIFPLHEWWGALNLFQYITVRSGGALLTAFLLCLLMGPDLIRRFAVWQHGKETVKDILPHEKKKGTPTMGGVMIVVAFLASALLWADVTSKAVWLIVGTALAFAAIGFTDDWLTLTGRSVRFDKKGKKQSQGGLSGRIRLGLEALFAVAFLLFYVAWFPEVATLIQFPFFKELLVSFGIAGLLIFGTVVIVGTANAVNLTDGLDGLVSIPAVILAATLAVLCYIVGRVDFTAYLNIQYIAGAGEIAVLCAAMAGAVLGFLWFNAPPARIFMGDTGSLAVGGMLGAVAVLIKQEFALLVIGGLFVLETLSVMVQVASYKLTGKRVFRMAPLHHHFEKLGWPESTIVIRFWILSILLALIGLATLKLR